MDAMAYQRFSDALVSGLRGDPEVLGVVALGSMARQGTEPDENSDHDFFVITRAGAQERFRRDLGWVPGSADIAFSYRETEHGVKAIFRDGHLIELAVFDPKELELARVNRFRVLFDRDGSLQPALEALAERSRLESLSATSDDRWLLGQLLSQLLIANGRARRGEELSARALLTAATRTLAQLLARHADSSAPELLDNLDPVRRFERAFPRIGARLRRATREDSVAFARTLAEIADAELGPRVPGFPADAMSAVRRRLELA